MEMDKKSFKKQQYVMTVEITIEDNSIQEAETSLKQILESTNLKKFQIQAGNTQKIRLEPKSKEEQVVDLIKHFQENNTLVRLSVVKAGGIKLSLPCRIINFDTVKSNVTVYHVDEKRVYIFNINEIDDFNVN